VPATVIYFTIYDNIKYSLGYSEADSNTKYIPVFAGVSARGQYRMMTCQVVSAFCYLHMVAQWRSGKALDLQSVRCGFSSTWTKLHNNLEQVVHTYVPLSPSSITWYWSKGSDVFRL